MTEDGSIVINTKIRTDGIKAGTAEIEAGVHRAADRVNTLGSNVKKTLNNQIDSFVKLNDEYSTQEQKVESLRQKVAAYANQRIPTTEYKEITAQIEQAQEKLNRLNDAKERFGATGGKVNSTSYKKMQYDIDELANTIKYAKLELDDLEASGKAFISGVNTKEAQADMEKLTAAEKKLSDMQKQLHTSYQSITDAHNSYLNKLLENERKNERKIAEINGKLEETRAKEVEAAVEANRLKAIGDNAKVGSKRIVNLNSELERLQARQNELKSAGIGSGYKEFDSNTRRIAKINETLRKYQDELKKTTKEEGRFGVAGGKIAGNMKKTEKSVDNARFSMSRMIKTGLLMNIVMRAFSGVMSGIKAGFDNLAQYSNGTNSCLSVLWGSLIRLQNSLATAFNPILTVITPILSRFIDLISTAITYVGMFFGYLAGNKTYTKALAVQKNYAASLDKTAKSIAIALAVAAIVLIITHWDQLKAAMSKLMDWIKGVFSVDWNAQLGVLGEGIEVLLSTVKGIFNSIKQICSGFITFLKGAFTGNIDMALKGVLGILRGVANLVFSIFKTPVNEVIALFNAMGQTIVKAINNLIDGLNHIKVPDWVPGIGGKGINLSHANFRRVPYLAQGAVIPAGNPFLAVLGDQTRGNNLEMPENLLRKIVSEESGKGTGMIKLVVNLDSRTVLERLINTAKEMQMSNGQNVFELGR